MKNKYFLITSALPYANGSLHIGHIAGAYLPADIFSRFKKTKEPNCVYICGIDAHGVAILLEAKKENKSPEEFLKINTEKIIKDFSSLNIQFDYFGTTHDPDHFPLAQEFFKVLHSNGYIKRQREQKYFCEKDKLFLPDRFVYGDCPRCAFQKARGDECPRCGEWLSEKNLVNPRCQICQSIPILKDSDEWFFLFSKFTNELKDWLLQQEDLKHEAKSFALAKVEEGLTERSISRYLDWGVPVPNLENNKTGFSKDEVIYVWFEALLGYISITKTWAKKIKNDESLWEKYWKNPNSKLYHFIGKDNLIFHTLFFPAILIGQRSGYSLPYNVPVNSHLTIEGEKMSTSSAKTFVWVQDFLVHFPADYLRYYLTIISPEKKDTHFSWREFKDKINKDLANNLGNLVHRTLKFIEENYSKTLPKVDLVLNDEDEIFIREIKDKIKTIEDLLEKVELKKSLILIFNLSQLGNQYFDKNKPWILFKENKEECIKTLKILIYLIEHLSILLYPFLPDLSLKIIDLINLNKSKEIKWKDLDNLTLNKSVHIQTPEPLIRKIEDSDIESLI